MKKLMITMVALASGLAAWTANAAGDASQGSSWVASEKTAGTWYTDSLWTSDTEGLLDNTEKVSFVVGEDTSKNCLKLSTGTDIVKRAINSDGSYKVTDQYFFDLRLGLDGQALDTLPTLGSDDKFALFLVDLSDVDENMPSDLKGTNLCAIAKNPNVDGGKMLLVYQKSNTVTDLFGSSASQHLTIQTFASVMKDTLDVRPGFILYINGVKTGDVYPKPVKIQYVVPYVDGTPDWAHYADAEGSGYLTGKLGQLDQRRLYLALSIIGGEDAQTMKGVAFAGNANITEVTTKVDAPDFVEPLAETAEVTLGDVTIAADSENYDKTKNTVSGDCTFTVTSTDAANKPLIQVLLGGEVVATIKSGETYVYTFEKGVGLEFKAYAVGATLKIGGEEESQYVTLVEALSALSEVGASGSVTLTLSADATFTEDVTYINLENESLELTIDLAGHTITALAGDASNDAIGLNSGTLTIIDTSDDKSGRVVVPEDAAAGSYAVSVYGGTLKIEAGIFDGKIDYSGYSGSTDDGRPDITISGGKFLYSANCAEVEEATDEDTEAEVENPDQTVDTEAVTAEPTFALADYVVEGKVAEKQTIDGVDYWVIVDDTTPAEKTWATVLGEADTDGAYTIDDADDFAKFAQGVADGLATKDVTFKLTGDIDLSNSTLDDGSTTIGIGVQNAKDMVNQITNEDKSKSDNPDYTNTFVKAAFQGTFDGGNYTISGVILPRTDYAGLFMSAYGATIKNLKVSLGNATGFATGDGNCGGGVIAGVTVNTTIENCKTLVAGEFNTFSSNKGMGGIVGYAGGGTTLSNCVNNLNIASTGNEKVGGLIACAEDGYHPTAEDYTGRVIENCTNNGAVTCGASDKVWAAGFVSYASGAVTFKGTCAQNGTVTGTGTKSVQYSIISPSKAGLVTVDANAVITTTQTGLLSSKQTVDGLNFAAIETGDAGSKATFKFNSAAAINGANLKVMASGATVTLATAGDKITLDESLVTATVALAESLKETYEAEKTEGDNNVNTYEVKAIVWTITYYDDATEPAQFATDTYSVANRETKTLNAGTRSGYTFKGWKTSVSAEIFVGSDYLKTATGDLSLYGVWAAATPAVTPVEPGSETACDDEASATSEAEAINNAKTTMIKVPEIDSLSSDDAKATFCNLFTATVVTSGEGDSTTYAVKVDLDPTAEGVKAIQEVIDAIAKPDADGAVKLDLTALATADQKATITAQPGLYYTVYAGADTPATLTATSSEQATTATLELEFPKKGTRGFYKIGVSAKQVTVPQAE